MTTSIESSAQFERDLRSANKEWKRSKDSSVKWSHGFRPSAGVRVNLITGEPTTGSESQQAKFRPQRRYCDSTHPKKDQNLVKMRHNWDAPGGRMRTKLYATREINDVTSRSLSELPPAGPTLARALSVSADAGGGNSVLYSFDRTDTPGRPLTLDIFVKKATSRDTERLVEKEYEILDTNGEPLKGRKARRNLRQTATDPGLGGEDGGGGVVEVDGFELV